MEYKDVTETIIGCVYNKMGFGFLESVYEKWVVPTKQCRFGDTALFYFCP